MNGDAERVGFTCEAFSARLRDSVPRIERWPTATRELCVARFTLEPGQHKTLERRRTALHAFAWSY